LYAIRDCNEKKKEVASRLESHDCQIIKVSERVKIQNGGT
jgi:hypothetical protein